MLQVLSTFSKRAVACSLVLFAVFVAHPAWAQAPGRKALVNVKKSQSAQFRHYQKLLKKYRYALPSAAEARTVIGLRGINLERQIFAEGARDYRKYTDCYVVLWLSSKGKKRVAHFAGSTTPGQARTRYQGTPDVNRDGGKDIAHLSPAIYFYKARKYKGQSAYGNGMRVPCYRDTNHDGHIDLNEKKASAQRGDTADGILFHRGRDNKPSSVGCQTMKPAVFDAFEKALGGQKRFTYVLIDVRREPKPLALVKKGAKPARPLVDKPGDGDQDAAKKDPTGTSKTADKKPEKKPAKKTDKKPLPVALTVMRELLSKKGHTAVLYKLVKPGWKGSVWTYKKGVERPDQKIPHCALGAKDLSGLAQAVSNEALKVGSGEFLAYSYILEISDGQAIVARMDFHTVGQGQASVMLIAKAEKRLKDGAEQLLFQGQGRSAWLAHLGKLWSTRKGS